MATQITLPRLGQGMESGVIVRWLKSEGDSVSKGEPLYELDTEKVTQEVEADAGGVLLRIVQLEGAEVAVGEVIALVGDASEVVPDAPAPAVAAPAAAVAPAAVPPVEVSAAAPPAATIEAAATAPAAVVIDAAPGGRIKASPLARRIAKERGVDLASLQGTGPDGRIVAEDVERADAGEAPGVTPTFAAPRRCTFGRASGRAHRRVHADAEGDRPTHVGVLAGPSLPGVTDR